MKFIERLERTRLSVRNALRNDWDKKKKATAKNRTQLTISQWPYLYSGGAHQSSTSGAIRVNETEFSSYIPFKGGRNIVSASRFRSRPSNRPENLYHSPPEVEDQFSLWSCKDEYELPSRLASPKSSTSGGRVARTRIKTNPWYRSPPPQTDAPAPPSVKATKAPEGHYSRPFEHDYATPGENDYEEIGSRRNLAHLKKRSHFDDPYPHSPFSVQHENIENVVPQSNEFVLQRHKLCSAIQDIYGQKRARKTFKLQPVPPKRTLSSLSSSSGQSSPSPVHSPQLKPHFVSHSPNYSPPHLSPSHPTSRKVTRLKAKLHDVVQGAVEQSKYLR